MGLQKLAIQQKMLKNLYGQMCDLLPQSSQEPGLIFESRVKASPFFKSRSPAVVSSLVPLTLPPPKIQLAEMTTAPFEGFSNQSQYLTPDMTFEIFMGSYEFVERVSVKVPPFQTYPVGDANKQYLEYLATCLDFELQNWGFRCRRESNRLTFRGRPEYLGLNLILVDMDTPHSIGGLKQGLSTLDQTPGEYHPYYLGSYRLNQTDVDLLMEVPFDKVKTFEPYLAFQNLLNDTLNPMGFRAEVTPESPVQIFALQANSSLLIQKLHTQIDNLEIQRIPLSFPEGLFESDDVSTDAEPWQGQLRIEGIDVQLPREREACLETLNGFFSGLRSYFNSEDHWVLERVEPGAGVQIEVEPSPHPLGIENLSLPSLQDAFNSFIQLLTRACDLGSEFLGHYQYQSPFGGAWEKHIQTYPEITSPLSPLYIHHRHFRFHAHPTLLKKFFFKTPAQLQQVLNQVFQWIFELPLDALPGESASTVVVAPHISPQLLNQDAEEPPPNSSFDHKI